MKEKKINKWTVYWTIFGLFIIIYLFISFWFSSACWLSSWLQVGGIFVSLYAMVVIMLQNNETIQENTTKQINVQNEIANRQISESILIAKNHIHALDNSTKTQIEELNKNTEKQINQLCEQTNKQIDSFAEQCNLIVSRLEDVTEELMKLSEVNLKILKLETESEEEKIKLKQAEITLLKEKDKENLLLNLPVLHFRFEIRKYWFFDHTYIFIYNQGNSAKNTTINIVFKNSFTELSTRINNEVVKHIDALSQHSFRIGQAKNYSIYDKVFIQVETRDNTNRIYSGEMLVDYKFSTWFMINLEEFRNVLK